ncbi:MAG TPA: GNAT family protein [Solirubrobacteraceae bacterium]|nr:GNAT family protein [Solirubrobacteraceae bacterium]
MYLQDGETAIRPFALEDLDALLELRLSSREQLEPWEPARSDRWWTREGQRAELQLDVQAWAGGTGYPFAVVDLAAGELVGRVSLANIVRGAWRNANLGYWIAERATRRGHATRAVRLVLRFAFEHAGLHRVQPAIIPRNEASQGVAHAVGFRLEGRALRYLQINGVWEDHDIYAMTAEEFLERS